MLLTGVPLWQIGLYACNILAFAALLVRIVSIRLARSYPALVVWLAANTALSLCTWIVRMDMLFYYWFFIFTQSFELFLYLFTVLEIYGNVLKSLPGLASTARWLIPFLVTTSAVGSASLLAFEGHPVSHLDWFHRVDRTVITTLVLFVLMITAFMVWFPVRVSRNTVVYSVGYAAYLVPKGASLFLLNSGHGVRWLPGAVGMVMSSICLLFWAVALDREGETAVVSPVRRFQPREEAHLLTQLEAINRILSHVAEK